MSVIDHFPFLLMVERLFSIRFRIVWWDDRFVHHCLLAWLQPAIAGLGYGYRILPARLKLFVEQKVLDSPYSGTSRLYTLTIFMKFAAPAAVLQYLLQRSK
ncbi:hypothetical protein EHS39_23395 [Ensifer sp. MPMI2T]|nr:hypothetical protein EHS39_23395 [Ensifer sp. MPMI2T]